jgi:hypothetical protein
VCTRETVAVGQSEVGLGLAASVLVCLAQTDRCNASGLPRRTTSVRLCARDTHALF